MSAKSVQVRLPELHAGQRRVYDNPARFRVIMCGRRWGKTKSGIAWLIEGAVIEHQMCAWFAPTYKLLKDAWRQTKAMLGDAVVKADSTEMRIEVVGGGEIDFWTMDNDKAGRGREYHRAFVDEAGYAKDFQNIFEGAILPTLSTTRGRAVIAGTPKGRRGFHKVYELGVNKEGDYASFRADSKDNPFFPAEEWEAMRRLMTPQQFDQEMRGIPADDGGNPFGLKAIQNAINPPSHEPPVAYGVDLAKSHDWTVIIGIDHQGQLCHIERWQGPWGTTRDRLTRQIGSTPAKVDSTGVGSPIVEDLQAVCPQVEGFVFTQTSKQMLIEGLVAGFQSGEIRITDDPVLVNELDSFGVEYRDGGRVRYEAPPGMHDDCVCALALAWQCYKDNGGEAATAPLVSFSRHAGGRVQRRGVRSCL